MDVGEHNKSKALCLLGGVKEKNFMLHYEFPGYATGELGRGGRVANHFPRREYKKSEKAIFLLIFAHLFYQLIKQ